jgi:hypothetical protein
MKVYFSTPTPGTANGIGDDVRVAAATTASVARGFYTQPFTVTLTTNETGAMIRYTLDGSDPTVTNGLVYNINAPIAVSTTTILRAATFVGGTVLPSRISTYSYIYLDAVLAQPAVVPGFPNGLARDTGNGTVPLDMAMDPAIVSSYAREMVGAMTAIPTLSLTAGLDQFFGSSGFYLRENERKVSMELIYGSPDNPSPKSQQIDAGAEPHSHFRLKQSIRINFRTEYGSREWETSVLQDFPTNGGSATGKLRTVILRGGNNRCKETARPDPFVLTSLIMLFVFVSFPFRLGTFLEPGCNHVHGR